MKLTSQAKGYPDLLTREFVNLVSSPSERNGFRSCPVHGLFDFDADGLGILHTYKHGATNTAHESPSPPCEKMAWLGLRSSDAFLVSQQQQLGLMTLSSRDRRRASRMLSWPAFRDFDSECSPRRELQVMLFVNKKAEIQLLDALPGGLSNKLSSTLPV
jgi:meiotic recombination protein SPO11